MHLPLWGPFSQLVDELTVLAVVLLERKRGFSATRAQVPPSFEQLLDEVRRDPPRIHWPARLDRRARVRVEVPAAGGETFLDWWPARVAGAGDAAAEPSETLVVFHHGLGEVAHDLVPRLVAARGPLRRRCDWVVLKALHHETYGRVSERFTADRDDFMRCLLGSASVARQVAKAMRGRYRHLVLCGVSLGGLVAQVEACREPRYDLYVPFVSGPDLRDVLCYSSFSRSIQGARVRAARSGQWRLSLDLSGLLARDPHGPPIRPLLATHDRLFRHAVQRAAWERVPRARVSSFPGGHITGAANVLALRRHLLAALHETRWAPAPQGPAAPQVPAAAASQAPIAAGA